MRQRECFMFFALGFAIATSLVVKDAFIWNYLLFAIPVLIMAIAYLIAISRDTKR